MATKRSSFDDKRDQYTADQTSVAQHLMCRARGCPNRWTVDVGNVCSAHFHASTHNWPQVTQEQLDAEADRALAASAGRAEVEPLTRQQKTEVLNKLRNLGHAKHGKAWAHALRDREMRGDRLTPTKREMWRAAIGQSEY